MIVAKFKGKNMSCNFETGRVYALHTEFRAEGMFNKKIYLVIYDEMYDRCCPYSSLENFLKNWEIIHE